MREREERKRERREGTKREREGGRLNLNGTADQRCHCYIEEGGTEQISEHHAEREGEGRNLPQGHPMSLMHQRRGENKHLAKRDKERGREKREAYQASKNPMERERTLKSS